MLLFRANCDLIAGAGKGVEAASRRLVAYLLQSFGAGHAEPLPLTLGHMIRTLNSS
ncbi:hypothetical protein [Streptosporangium sandarakinum]